MTDTGTDARTEAADETTAGAPDAVEIDRISLAQALQDFEVANARVMDLTSRLTASHQELVAARSELEKLKLRNRVLRTHNRRLRRDLKKLEESRAVRSAVTASRLVSTARKRIGK